MVLTVSSSSEMVAIPVEMIMGLPVEATFFRRGRCAFSNEAIFSDTKETNEETFNAILKDQEFQIIQNQKNTLKEIENNIFKQNRKVKDKEEEIRDFNKIEEDKKQSLVQSQKEFRQFQTDFNIKSSKLNEIKVILARLETKYEDLNKEMRDDASKIKLNREVQEINLEEYKEKILKEGSTEKMDISYTIGGKCSVLDKKTYKSIIKKGE